MHWWKALAHSAARTAPDNEVSQVKLAAVPIAGVQLDEPLAVVDRENREAVEGYPPVVFRPTAYTRVVKPALDRAAAVVALVVFAIPMVLTAAMVALSMGRPLLFRQRRVGLNGEVFNVLKFRTMGKDRRDVVKAVGEDLRRTHKTEKDPRHTPTGRFLRRFSLDELPQLFNILRGEMSVVGPRPELESVVVRQYPPGLEQRHLVRPGLTGLWQISARGDGPMHENGEWDLKYVEAVSPMTDLLIVLKTPFVIFGRNAGK